MLRSEPREGGTAGSSAFQPDVHLIGLQGLRRLGVTWAHTSVPGDSLSHVSRSSGAVRRDRDCTMARLSHSRVLTHGRSEDRPLDPARALVLLRAVLALVFARSQLTAGPGRRCSSEAAE